MSYTMKLLEIVIERRLRKETQVIENQFSFMHGRSTIETTYLLWRIIEQYQMDQQDFMWHKCTAQAKGKILWTAVRPAMSYKT